MSCSQKAGHSGLPTVLAKQIQDELYLGVDRMQENISTLICLPSQQPALMSEGAHESTFARCLSQAGGGSVVRSQPEEV